MAEATEKRLKEILAQLYAAAGHRADCEALAENAVAYMQGSAALRCDIAVRAVKGGTYKIKEYYLEDNELSDIRGASALITEVQEKIVPDLLWQIVGFDGVIYNGGGNMLALIPDTAPADIAEQLEQAAERALLTANVAYICTDAFPLSRLLGKDYRSCVAGIEQQLTDRKKSRAVCDLQPQSEMNGETICDVEIRLPETRSAGAYCSRCCKRIASYQLGGEPMCGGCAHKYIVGKEHRQRFVQLYQAYLRAKDYSFAESVVSPKEFEDIDADYIAVVYADGNNMGGLIQNINQITAMMDFSAFVKQTMQQLVFRALAACRVLRFEIVAVGGDDIFILLPGKKAVAFSCELMRCYKEAFDSRFGRSRSTLSVGICIAKKDEKIKVMLEAAEDKLRGAKRLMKQDAYAKAGGSLSFIVMDSYEGLSSEHARRSMLPYSYEQLRPVLKFTAAMQQKNMKTRIRNIAEAYAKKESEEEMSLFFRYINAKEKSAEKQIQIPDIPGYTTQDGFYTDSSGTAAAFWEDIIDLMKFYDTDLAERRD